MQLMYLLNSKIINLTIFICKKLVNKYKNYYKYDTIDIYNNLR